MLNENFVLVGVFLQSYGGLDYLIDTLKGRVQPNKVSWLLWAIAPMIAFFAEVKQGVGIQSLSTFIVGFVPLVIFIASFVNKKAEWKITKFDIFCGFVSILGLVLWLFTRVGNVAIFFSIIADGMASLATIVKSFKEPESESYQVFFFSFINAAIGLLVIKNWSFQYWGFPLYLLFVNAILAVLIKFKIGNYFTK